MRIVSVAIRLLLTAAILFVVWHHAHWSVALTLTGLSIENEFSVVLLRWLLAKVR